MRNKIVLFSGKAGTGKSTCAEYLYDIAEEWNPVILSFAGKVKEIAINSFGWDRIKDAKGRKLLQDIGKAGRAYDIDTWVKQTYSRFEYFTVYQKSILGIIDDWRFPNEYDYLKQYVDVFAVRIIDSAHEILKDTPAYLDESETALDSFIDYNYVIKDAPDVEALQLEVQKIYTILKEN